MRRHDTEDLAAVSEQSPALLVASLAVVVLVVVLTARGLLSASSASQEVVTARATDVEMHEANLCPLDCDFNIAREFPCVCPSEASQ